jgi:sulfoxide reductase heme-binding subunit YedZ
MEKRTDWQRWIVHGGAWLTLGILIVLFIVDTSAFNPIRTLEHRTGKAALIFLILSLSCSPLSAILGWKDLSKRRKALGVYGFMFAVVHLLIFLWLDYGFQFASIWRVVLNSFYIWIGLAAFIMLVALAVTTFKKMKQLLKKNWKRLHRLVYIISPLVVLHFILVQKGNLLSLQGNLVEPLIYGGIVLLLLVLRLPPVKRALTNLRSNIQNRSSRSNPV